MLAELGTVEIEARVHPASAGKHRRRQVSIPGGVFGLCV